MRYVALFLLFAVSPAYAGHLACNDPANEFDCQFCPLPKNIERDIKTGEWEITHGNLNIKHDKWLSGTIIHTDDRHHTTMNCNYSADGNYDFYISISKTLYAWPAPLDTWWERKGKGSQGCDKANDGLSRRECIAVTKFWD